MLTRSDLNDLFDEARQVGYASAKIASAAELKYLLRQTKFDLAADRTTGRDSTRLRSLTESEARPNSMSRSTGRGAQPLHTDGAHLTRPPDYVVLYADSPSPTATYVLRPNMSHRDREDLAHGLFKVNTGKISFLAPAVSQGRLRFDPICMEPLDARARRAKQVLTNTEGAHAHSWDLEVKNFLVVDNRAALHARGEVEGDEDRALTRFCIEERSQ